MAEPVLAVEDLVVRFDTPRGAVNAVNGVSLAVSEGETLGLVGESGCGKSTLGRAVLRLVEPKAGAIRFEGIDLTTKTRRQMRPVRRGLQIVFQDPAASLDPRWTVGELIAEPLAIHRVGSRTERRARAKELLAQVGLPAGAAERYPHTFSGGQRQRIGIARALALAPKVVILDEPVSALDVSVQAQILNLLADLQERLGVAFLFISHDLAVVEHVADRVAVMYLGRIVETAPREALWRRPAHPYTRLLLAAAPRIEDAGAPRRQALSSGDLPSPYAPPSGCAFRTRCPYAVAACAEETPKLVAVSGEGHEAACLRAGDI